MNIAHVLYDSLMRAIVPAYLLRLLWRSRREPPYRQALGERLGVYRSAPSSGWVWVHAVSLGETRAAAALVQALRAQQPGLRLLLTHGTATGREAGLALLQAGDRQAWLPWDTPGAVRRFLAHHRPRVGVLMETEVWPNLLHAARAQSVPMVLASARLSERSLRRGQRVAGLIHPAMARLAAVLAQSPADAQRLVQAGAPAAEVCGNLKFDMAPAPDALARGRGWHELAARPVVLAAVTREGEEPPLLAAWQTLPAPRPLLVVVPRHPQRFDAVADAVLDAGFTLSRRSTWPGAPDAKALQADVWLGDSVGEMPAYYAAADLALLGGSFAPLGGQNLIEAAACGCPVLMGPHTFNFAEAAGLALAAGAAARVPDLTQAVRQSQAWLQQPQTLAAMRQAALAFAQAHRGAAARMAGRILAIAAPAPPEG
ncbi:MAG TPA: lipid IV(A) 3-deoxy-D-manno-octulosonic acid transferase [Burkholderiaceae bacterium]|nr:lipid IV(A) 3-deoxy-D-manno-octulosonic acid transferase [Burkholderiaceae bacterium]